MGVGDWVKRVREGPSIQGEAGVIDACLALTDDWGSERLRTTPLVLPTDDFYPVDLRDPDSAERMFAHTVEHADLVDWSVRLVLEDHEPEQQPRGTANVPTKGAVSSGLNLDESTDPPTYLVTYVLDDLRSAEAFVFHCAQQLSAAILLDIEEIPGGDENFWNLVDVATCFLGFGIFACNGSFIHEASVEPGGASRYWWQSRGTLTLDQLALSLAFFVRVRNIPPSRAAQYLSANANAAFKKALRVLDKRYAGELEPLRGDHEASGRLSFASPGAGGLAVVDDDD